jgi:hypothetical protein
LKQTKLNGIKERGGVAVLLDMLADVSGKYPRWGVTREPKVNDLN